MVRRVVLAWSISILLHSDFASAITPLTISLKGDTPLCLDLYAGDTRNGAPLQVWECNGHQSQLWLFEANTFAIQYAADPTKCVDAGSVYSGNKLQIWDCNGVDWQNFGYDTTSGTIYLGKSLSAAAADKGLSASVQDMEPLATLCLDSYQPIKQGNAVQVWACNNQAQQLWNIQYGTSIRVEYDYKLCIDLEGGKDDNGTPIQMWTCNGLQNQQWIVDGTAIRWGGNTKKCIDAYSPMKAGGNLQLWDCNGASQQQFGYDANLKSLYLSASETSSAESTDLGATRPFATYCLDLPGGTVSQGTKPDIWNCNQCWNQQWTVAVAKYSAEDTSRVVDTQSHIQVRDTCPPKPGPGPAPGPGPSPGKACTAAAGWPKFDNQAGLQASPWAAYFTAVYGAVPTAGYPICMSDFGMLYTAEMTKAGVTAPSPAKSCPTSNSKGAYFQHEIAYPAAFPGASYILQPPPYAAADFPSNAWVEIMHGVGGGVSKDEGVGAWFYYLKGSGMWFNLGKTISFPEHKDSWSHFGSKAGGGLTTDEAMSKAASAAGFDSVVYLNHHDVGTCPTCCKAIKVNTILVEIVGVKLVGAYACAGPKGSGVKAGWLGSRACSCNECHKNCFINCQGVPTMNFDTVSNVSSMLVV